MTTDTERFLAVAGEFLRADPAGNSVMLTVTENLRVSGAAPAASAPLYGWWQRRRGTGSPPRSCTRRISPSCSPR